jgi:superfamily II RNA helicase
MVKVCSITNYPKDNEAKYCEHFQKFNYPLHIFQKYAIEGIVEGHHVLVTAPTGSGKSLPAEFALDYFHSKGKKTIYCSPIKSLSNQKFYDFSQKYPHISIGLITGDIKTNPDADVLIMTTEILLNKLYQIKSTQQNINSAVSFEMDIETELGGVIFDEIHFINDENRGTVWENSIMLLPRHIQMIGLSATLDDPSKFAYWLENRGEENTINKIVYLTAKKDRTVPLIHYSFITTNQGIFKAIKDKTVQEEIKKSTNKPFILQDSKGKFNDEHFNNMTKMLKLFATKEIRVKRAHVINQVTQYLTENEMTPAICYVFSIKKIEECAREVTTNLLEFDSKVPYIIKRECEQILRNKLPNFEEYLHLPEYVNLVSLLEKGIATHHSKMLPVLREIVELFFARGYIKLLFATESVAIGLNLPVKTCIFTDIYKHDGNSLRVLHGHEYTQAAGRAGRLGLDTVGHVIHLNNIFRTVDTLSYKTMMNGKPQALVSKFKISYNLLLNLVDTGDNNIVNFAKRSMITGDLDAQLKEIYYKISTLSMELDKIRLCSNNLRTPSTVIEEYINLQKNKLSAVNKKRKEIERNILEIQDNYKFIENDKNVYKNIYIKENEIIELQDQYNNINSYIQSGVDSVLRLLLDDKYLENNTNKDVPVESESNSISLTTIGKFATHLREIHCLIFSKLIDNNILISLSSKQLVALFSCFTNITVQDDFKDIVPNTDDILLKETVVKVSTMYDEYAQKEEKYGIHSGTDYTIHYDLLNYTSKWCDCENIVDCKLLLQQLEREKQISLGEFVKAMLKINNISTEMEKIAELTGNIAFLSKLKEIPPLTLKYVVTNQSLYV